MSSPPSRTRQRIRLLHRRSPGILLIALAVVAALLPLALATLAFGHAFRSSETDSVDARLGAAVQLAHDRVIAANADALSRARVLASSRAVQLALLRGDRATLAAYAVRRRGLTIQIFSAPVPATTPRRAVMENDVVVVSSGRVIGVVRTDVTLAPLLASVGAAAGAEVALLEGAVATTGPLVGLVVPATAGQPVWAQAQGREYRAQRGTLGAGRAVAAAVPKSVVDNAVRGRQLRIGAAGLLTVASVAILALVLTLRRRRGGSPRSRIARSPMALLGDVVAAADNPRALLPMLLDAAVGAVDAAGGFAVWDGERIAETGFVPDGATPLRLELDDQVEAGTRQVALFPRRGSFPADDRAVAAALIAEGRIALENARLHNIVRKQAVTDELTDLANRRRFMEVLRQEVARSRRFELSLALVLFDLDHFKQINDRFGHQTGDEVLRETAAVISSRVRETDLAARIGGEEFAVVLAGTDADGAIALAENLRVDLSTLVAAHGGESPVTASFGVAALPPGGDAEALIAAADRALYRAKAAGRNRVRSEHTEPSSPR